MRRTLTVIMLILTSALFVPATSVLAVAEVDAPSCRWNHIGQTTTYVTYFWGSNLQGNSLWKTAFQSSLSDWNGISTRMRYRYDSYGDVYINTYRMADSLAGYAAPSCSGAVTAGYDVLGNTYYDTGYSSNYRRSITGHELGHGFSLGHISDSGIALMGNNPNPDIYYRPQTLDTNLVNEIYP